MFKPMALTLIALTYASVTSAQLSNSSNINKDVVECKVESKDIVGTLVGNIPFQMNKEIISIIKFDDLSTITQDGRFLVNDHGTKYCRLDINSEMLQVFLKQNTQGQIEIDLEAMGFKKLKIDGKIRYAIHSSNLEKIQEGKTRFLKDYGNNAILSGCPASAEGINLFGDVRIVSQIMPMLID